ncbi:MAG: alpha/beta hydrolase [Pseudomonadota bacterium]|nr:alpha/beta hydrolase [Pseudomonadota bacterium]
MQLTRILAIAFCSLLASIASAQEELKLWPNGAPGSENWRFAETVTQGPSGDRVIANVREPTLTVFLPDAANANGTAVVILPGGALRVLGFDNEGVKVAQWLNARGIAAFVLKYRTLQSDPDAPRPAAPPAGMAGPGREELVIRNGNANPAPDDAALDEVLRFAIADTQQALTLVRSRAAEWNVDTARVGLMGFSAGGGVAIGTAMAPAGAAYPDFIATLYGPSLMDVNLPAHAPPLFIAVGNAHFNVTNGSLALFAAWKAAGKPAELHVYDQVSGGFGMTARGLPVDGWIERFHEWMSARDIVVK